MSWTNRHGDFVNYTGSLAPKGRKKLMSSKITFSLQAQSDTHEHIRVIQRRHTTNAQDKKKPTHFNWKLFFFSQIFFCVEKRNNNKRKTTKQSNGISFFLILFVLFLCCCCYLVSLCERQLQQHAWQIKKRTDQRRPRLERHWLVGLLKGFSKKGASRVCSTQSQNLPLDGTFN